MVERLSKLTWVNGRAVVHCRCGWKGVEWATSALAKQEHDAHMRDECPIGRRTTS